VENFGLWCERGQVARMKSSHIHAEIEFNLVLRGALNYSFGGRRVPVVAGELAIFWAALPHQLDAIEGDTQAFWLTLPLPAFLGFDLPPALVQSLLRGELLRETVNLPLDETRFALWQDDIQRGEERPALLEIEARLRRLARTLAASSTEFKAPATPSELNRVERMAAFIAQNYALSISLPDIAEAANLNTNYASTLFKREFGSTLGDFLLRTRLAHAQRLLATTDKTVGDVAISCGFGSIARFHAAFKEKMGQSPRAYRVSCRGGKG